MKAREIFEESREVLENFLNNEAQINSIEEAAKLMSSCLDSGGKIISCGNGGSMSDAMHFAEELSGRFRNDRKGLAAVSISDPSHITCVANDYGFEKVFSRYVESLGKQNDILLAISTSGNSKNVLEAAKAAAKMNMKIVALTGKGGGQLKDFSDIEIRAPHSDYSDRAQEIHIKVIHCLIQLIEQSIR